MIQIMIFCFANFATMHFSTEAQKIISLNHENQWEDSDTLGNRSLQLKSIIKTIHL